MSNKSESTKNFLSGWNLTGIIALVLIANFLFILFFYGIDNKTTISLLIRSTARFSFVLFILAFSASSMYYFWKSRLSKWVLSNRRYIGVSFAISHYLHLLSLLMMTYHISFNVFEDRGLVATIGGGIAYVFITLMTITSFDRTKKMLTPRTWKLVHTLGGYIIWLVFVKSYVLVFMENPMTMLFSFLLIATLALRIMRLIKSTS